jgi:RimJ/RimL family protein N-acetyltransferase
MDNKLFTGELVRLTSEEPKIMAEAFSRWGRDSEYWRLLAGDPNRLFSIKSSQRWFDEMVEKETGNDVTFYIRILTDDRMIGFVGLDGIDYVHGNAWVGIGIGERDCWGKGYGTDAMRIILRYAFTELNLHRVTLGVFEYNPRAYRSYIKAGFKEEGRMRGDLRRDGQRWDGILMGILRSEWSRL